MTFLRMDLDILKGENRKRIPSLKIIGFPYNSLLKHLQITRELMIQKGKYAQKDKRFYSNTNLESYRPFQYFLL